MTAARVEAVCASAGHTMSKPACLVIRLVAGQGVEGDVHRGETITLRPRGRPARTEPNRRQVHLVPGELLDDLRTDGYDLAAGRVGENITTRDLDLAGLAEGTRLHLGDHAVVELTGLRTPCRQLESIQPGLMGAMLGRDASGRVVPRAGVMAVVVTGGDVQGGDRIVVEPPPPHRPLRPL